MNKYQKIELFILIGTIAFFLMVAVIFVSMAWILSPTEFVVTINMTADDNLVKITDTIENISNERIELYCELGDNKTILYHKEGVYDKGWEKLET